MQHELEAIFRDSFHEYGDAIFRFCLMKVSDAARAEDMTQDVFMRYWQCLREGREMTNTRSFLYTIANNLAKDWYKKKKADSLDRRMESGYEPEGEYGDQHMTAQYREALEAIQELSEDDREVVLLAYVEGLPPHQIAEIRGETANTVSVRLNRAIKRVQKLLHI